MTLLLRDPDVDGTPPADGAPPAAAPEPPACPTCQTPVEPGQDWCLQCGQAQPGRLMGRPGKRAAATLAACTALLVGGAVAASYAALRDDDPAPAPTQVAQAPAPAAPTPAPAATPSSAAPATPSTATPAQPGPAATDTTATPPPTSTSDAPTPSSDGISPVAPAGTGTGSTGTGTGSTGTGTGSTGTGTGTGTAETRTDTTTPPSEPEPQPIKLADDAVALYDPYKRDSAAGDPKRAFDGNPDTSLPITVPAGSTQVAAGILVDLRTQQGIRRFELTTKTPGFRIELYATDSDELPPDVLDTRWAHIKDISKVGVKDDGKQAVTLGSGTSKYRYVLLWLTVPPADGVTTVRVSELKLLD